MPLPNAVAIGSEGENARQWHYKHCGLRISSDLSLPELDAGQEDGASGEPDVRVAMGDTLGEEAGERNFAVSSRRCRFGVPEAGLYEVRDGREIVVRPATRAAPATVRLFVLGSAWGALLHQRGSMALHAGVTASEGGAVAFCGPPAAGKSSTVAWLVRRGHVLLSDDLSRLEVPTGGPARVWPSTPRLKLSRAALETNGWTAEGLEAELPLEEKFNLPWEGPRAQGPAALRAIYLLEWGEPGVSRLRGIAAVRRFLAAATYRHQLLEPPPQLSRHWQQCVEIVRRVPVWELSRPRDWGSLDQVMEGVVDGLIPTRQ